MCAEHQPQHVEKAAAFDQSHVHIIAKRLRLVSATRPHSGEIPAISLECENSDERGCVRQHQPQHVEKATAFDKSHTHFVAKRLRLVSATQPRSASRFPSPLAHYNF